MFSNFLINRPFIKNLDPGQDPKVTIEDITSNYISSLGKQHKILAQSGKGVSGILFCNTTHERVHG